jgi:hypothetical protein
VRDLILYVCCVCLFLQRRDAMKLQDRVTGAFGDKHSDDSDDETGEGSKGLVQGSAEEMILAAKIALLQAVFAHIISRS